MMHTTRCNRLATRDFSTDREAVDSNVSVPTKRPRRSTLTDEVADHVRALVMTGGVREGDFLRLDQLADELGISVTPVREGLLALQAEGFVELLPRRGFVARAVTQQDIADIFWVQGQIEGELARRAAAHFGAQGVDSLLAIQEALESAASSGDHNRVEVLNYDFHHAIAMISESARLRRLLKQVAHLSPSQMFPEIQGWSQAAVEDHGAIIEALRAGDADAAGAAMSAHVIRAGEVLSGNLGP